jgi:hypothetical protein
MRKTVARNSKAASLLPVQVLRPHEYIFSVHATPAKAGIQRLCCFLTSFLFFSAANDGKQLYTLCASAVNEQSTQPQQISILYNSHYQS